MHLLLQDAPWSLVYYFAVGEAQEEKQTSQTEVTSMEQTVSKIHEQQAMALNRFVFILSGPQQ